MRFTLQSLIVVALAVAANAAPSKLLHPIQKFAGKVKPNSFIVTLKAGVDKKALFKSDPAIASGVTHGDWTIINGFAGTFTEKQLNALRESDAVEAIQEDGIFTIQATETNAPWGLGRISSKAKISGSTTALTYRFNYHDTYQGQGVDIYVVDTGININHTDFGGRAKYGWSGSGLAQLDDHGHGTHVAGIAGGTRFGVAKRVNLISVKVLDSAGSGTLSNVVGGFNYVGTAARSSGRPSVASASLGGSASSSIDSAVSALVSQGVHVVVAAGNSNVNAANTSPARVAGAITVGAATIGDAKASFSNYGTVVDIWAPGVDITSAFIGSTTATHVYSGTSQATPHVSGEVAVWISANGNASPASVSSSLYSVSGAISGIPSGPNRFLQNIVTV